MKDVLKKEFSAPSSEFVKLISKQVYSGAITSKLLEQFTELLKRSISNHVNDIISARLNMAIANTDDRTADSDKEVEDKNISEEETKDKIVTTTEELEGFYIVKSILRNTIPAERITPRDALSYFAIFADDNNRKPICRLYLNSQTNKQIALFDEDKKELKYKINSIDDIYQYSDELIKSVSKYI